LVPSLAQSVRRWLSISRLAAVEFRVCQEPKQLSACGVEGTLLGFGLTMGEQRSAVVADEVANDLFDRPPPKVAVHLQNADDLTAQRRHRNPFGSTRPRAARRPGNDTEHGTIRLSRGNP